MFSRNQMSQRGVNFLAIAFVLPLIPSAFLAQTMFHALVLFLIVAIGICGLMSIGYGLKQRDAYRRAESAKGVSKPWILLGIVGLALAAGSVGGLRWGFFDGAVTTVLAALLGVVAFGIDPVADKGLDTADARDGFQGAQRLHSARQLVDELERDLRDLGHFDLAQGATAFKSASTELFRAVEADPAHWRNVRKLLGIYLEGLHKATHSLVAMSDTPGAAEATRKMLALLKVLAESYRAAAEAYRQRTEVKFSAEVDALLDALRRG